MVASTTGNDSQVFTAGEATYALPQSAIAHQGHAVDATVDYSVTSFLGAPRLEDSPVESLFFAATQSIFPEIEFSWDVDFGSYKIPGLGVTARNPQSGNVGKRTSRQGRKDTVSVDAPLQCSVWLYEPEANGQAGSSVSRSAIVSPYLRDSMFAMVLANNPTPHRVPTFPSAELLGYMIETYFKSEDPKSEAFIHRSSFDPSATSQELFSAVVSSGASCISTPAIWQFGLALDELTASVIGKRVSMDHGVAMVSQRYWQRVNHMLTAKQLESSCLAVRDITFLQASVLHLETGQWSGFNRQTEVAESFAPQLLTVSLL
jgi:hypothetical protein